MRLYATGADGMPYFPKGVFKRITWMGDRYCYVPGEFAIRLPKGIAKVQLVKGFDYRPHTEEIDVPDGGSRDLLVKLEKASDLPARGLVQW